MIYRPFIHQFTHSTTSTITNRGFPANPGIPQVKMVMKPSSDPVQLSPGKICHTDGIEHPDFDASHHSAYDVVLFHELVHAFNHASGVYNFQATQSRPTGADFASAGNPPDYNTATEEMMVVGLYAGKALKYTENHYRKEKGIAVLRSKYADAGIPTADAAVASFDFGTASSKDYSAVLATLGFTAKPADKSFKGGCT
ncbi:type III secretion system effector protein [bacterium]|nr:type III secretion system effector protein [bacterium]